MMHHISLDTNKVFAWSEDGIGWMVFNNPHKLNAMGVGIPTIMYTFRDNPDVCAVVTKGAGDLAFVSGADISGFDAQRSNPETMARYTPHDHQSQPPSHPRNSHRPRPPQARRSHPRRQRLLRPRRLQSRPNRRHG